ncbi:hypothetical protein [Raineyella fluvialis]|uniref:DUF998 domain-containing protein n=1 Tax=Raineyella fluvialis TaxID=2662261 RepID=A0A5Q2FCZ6_9ACTN|nr:hypothetical protein [Raineyella fluvialis]QGF24658.1 hypothetical protein Rai3103_14595 [Raineyella fluvialis]
MSARSLIRWSGFAWIMAGVLFVLATVVHPSTETPQTILSQSSRLIAGHWLSTFSLAFLLLGLPGLYVTCSGRSGRLGLTGFLLAFLGAVLFAVSNDYGFTAPVLARADPRLLQEVNAYPPVAIMNALFVATFVPGFVILGIAVERSHVFPRRVGVLLAVGVPLYLVCSLLSLLVLRSLWIAVSLSAVVVGLGWVAAGHTLWSGHGPTVVGPAGAARTMP